MKYLILLGESLVVMAIGVILAILLMEWVAGCGDTYTNNKGKVTQHECVFLNKS